MEIWSTWEVRRALKKLEKCRKHSPAARVFHISLVFSNARRVLSQCNTRLRLLYLLNKELNFVRIKAALFHVRRAKVGRSPFWKTRKKSHLASSMIYTKWSNPIGCCALAKDCDWFRQITPLSNLTRVSLLVKWKLTAKQELSGEIYNS